MILISKVFQRLFNSFHAIFRQEISTALPWKFKTSACLFTFYQGNIFLPTADNQTFSIFVSKVQNEQGILLSVQRKLA